ncbi:MAG TPA: lipoyl synthase [Bacteroidales bacterium]|nr:MAG: lipoyl synthase [Bacteroidetes bacterium GWE2_42_24]HAQ64587.1 lipoyl synthase [Bacteroidales bacterium]HBZ68072.1 lipoyl synthase [Bacteroidales bacterium]
MNQSERKPDWLRIKARQSDYFDETARRLACRGLHTICTSGKCPNLKECWSAGTATFMILGEICTRSCRFCATRSGRPLPPDPYESMKVADAVREMKLRHCVLTSVDRDDLPDGGAAIWKATIEAVRTANPMTTIEVLIPDFKGDHPSLELVISAKPDILGHNLETVRRLTPGVRSKAGYDRSLELLKRASDAGMVTKSGIMAGLGETTEEILETMDDLLAAGCRIFTMGQYLRPSFDHLPVSGYMHPDTFGYFRKEALAKGFMAAECGPLVRSSYHAGEVMQQLKK